MTLMFLANSVVLMVLFVDQPGLGLTLIRLLTTLLFYPIVVILAAQAIGLRKMSPGETDRLGQNA